MTELVAISARAISRHERRTRMFHHQRGLCWLCARPMVLTLDFNLDAAATFDHVVPVSRGGNDSNENIRLAHKSCNSRRGSKPPPTPRPPPPMYSSAMPFTYRWFVDMGIIEPP